LDLVLRTLVAFFLVFLLTRIIGRRELNSMEPFDIILLVVIGDLIQNGVTQSDYSVTGIFLVVTTMAVLTVGTSYVGFRFRRFRPLLEGEPIILVDQGRPIAQNLRRERLTIEELEAEARQQQIDSLHEVKWAVLETSGDISFIR
jgi:uncharacterized membrane protein YcaP (DUF421 family)